MGVIFRYINGKIRPIKVDDTQTTNEYMNNKIRNKKEYTEKDIKTIYELNRNEEVTGYELNGIYLLKNDNPWRTVREDKHFEPYRWVINETKNEVPTTSYNGVEWVKHNADDKVTYFHTFKEGKEALIKLANKKE